MKTQRMFQPGDRYRFDFNLCTTKKGWAQFDTRQDASYFGVWVNPFGLKITTYCEGDVTVQECESIEEFKAELERMKNWYDENAGPNGFRGIDPGFNESLKNRFNEIGLTALLH